MQTRFSGPVKSDNGVIFVIMRHDPPELVGVYDTLEAAEKALSAEKQEDSSFSGWIIEQTFGTIDERSRFVDTH